MVARHEIAGPENACMESFRRIARDMREQRQALTRSSSDAGRGFRFCTRHSLRYAAAKPCPSCFPSATSGRYVGQR